MLLEVQPSTRRSSANGQSTFGKLVINRPQENPSPTMKMQRKMTKLVFTCTDCQTKSPIPTCQKCAPEDVMPVVNELFRDVPDDDEGSAERTSEQRLMRVHRNLGHPSNRLLVQLLKEAKAPQKRY